MGAVNALTAMSPSANEVFFIRLFSRNRNGLTVANRCERFDLVTYWPFDLLTF
jgi:hypothetical protein